MVTQILSGAKRRFVLLGALTAILAGCGGSDSTQKSSTQASSQMDQKLLAVSDVYNPTTIVAKHSGKCLDVIGGSTANGAQTDQLSCNSQPNQSWSFKDMGSGQYQIIADHSGKCLDVPGSSTTNGVTLQQLDCAPGANKQLWTLQNEGDGFYKIISAANGKCVDVAGISLNEQQKVQQWDCLDQDNQRWKIGTPALQPTTFYRGAISAKHSQKCMNVLNASTADSTRIDQLTCNSQPNQAWTLKDMGAGQYQIIADHSGKCLDLPDGSTANATYLQQLTCGSDAKQLWTLEDRGSGFYKIRSAVSNKCVDVAGQATMDGQGIQQWDCVEQDNQLWKLGVIEPNPAVQARPYITDGSKPDSFFSSLVFSDEFNGSSLSSAKWAPYLEYWQTPQTNPDDHFDVSGGNLNIWLTDTSAQDHGGSNTGHRVINTDRRFTFKYVYIEVEANLGNGGGHWPGIWTLSSVHDDEYHEEIDIMEAYPGGGPETGWGPSDKRANNFAATVWGPGGIQQGDKRGDYKLSDALAYDNTLSDSFHKYGVLWEPDGITFYFDGKRMGDKIPASDVNDFHFLLLQEWAGNASGPVDPNTLGKAFGTNFNYVRIWGLSNGSTEVGGSLPVAQRVDPAF